MRVQDVLDLQELAWNKDRDVLPRASVFTGERCVIHDRDVGEERVYEKVMHIDLGTGEKLLSWRLRERIKR